MYATGVRVGELTGLDIDDIDFDRNVIRVLGKGRKERTVPFGQPAAAALKRWIDRARPAIRQEGAGPALFLGPRGQRLDPRAVRTLVPNRTPHATRAPHTGPPRT